MGFNAQNLGWISNLNMLMGSLFVVMSLGVVVTRQIKACLQFFIWQSVFLAISAVLLGSAPLKVHLLTVGVLNIITKVILIPFVLRRFLHKKLYTRREINQVFGIPTSLLISLFLILLACFISKQWLSFVSFSNFAKVNLTAGLSVLFLGAYVLINRREAVPQLLGLLVMENGAFFAGIAIAPHFPMIVEVALMFDLLIFVFIAGILTKALQEKMGTTSVGKLTNLREEAH
jgi:hydrogenase-4 component E